MAKENKAVAEKKIVITDLNAEIAELAKSGVVAQDVQALIDAGLVAAELDEVEVEAGKFSGDYVRFSLGANATDLDSIIKALTAIAGGNVTAPKADGEDEPDDRKPSLVKFALYGADLSARSRTSQRIKAAAQGPEKSIEKMADMIVKNKPGTSKDQALEMARAILA